MVVKKRQLPQKKSFKVRVLALCLLAGMFVTSTGHAAEISHPEQALSIDRPDRPNLKQCIEIALEKNRFRFMSRYSVEIAEAQHQQALSGYWPQIGASANYSIMDQDPNFIFPSQNISLQGAYLNLNVPTGLPAPYPAEIVQKLESLPVPEQDVKLMDRKNLVSSLNATLPLYTGGQVSAMVRQAKSGIKAASEEARRTDLQIAYDTTRYYYGAVLARELVQIGKDALARMEVTLELTENLYTHGSGTVKKTDYLRNKTVVEWLRTAVTALVANEELAKAALTNSMGLDWESPVEPAPEELPFYPSKVELKDLVNGAYSFNPDWLRLEAGLEAASAKIDEAKSGHLPKVGLFGNLTRIDNSYDKGIATPDNKNSWTIGIGMEIPLFNGLRTTNEVREAKARLAKLKQQQFLLKEGLALQVKHIFIQLMSTQEQKSSSEAAANSSEENRSLNERAYQEELVETKDVIEAQLVESLMKAQYRKSLYDNLEARANMDFVIGKQITDIMAATPAL
ncbi:TolC family protein [Desulfopila sp. IMCC35006]|uniref:TolC family protein n=1 Tax=Desulfopila sp. IMCC35006 TaxID=2569542 RepID=UPI0010AB79DB|nr:TolC family protein [Desulfopila sp. IMCC35006]TKB25524.1 TolC family protein [Desulfopila sp. IMCC35006]